MGDEPTYRITRNYFDHPDGVLNETIRTGLTLDEAQAHCRDKETSSSTATTEWAKALTAKVGPWFDGYDEERR